MSRKLTTMKVTDEVTTQIMRDYAPSGMSFHVADLNQDGYDDIVVMGFYWPSPDNPPPAVPQTGRILLNDRKGGFTVAKGDAPVSVHPREVVVADFDGDKRLDILIVDHGYDTNPFPGFKNQLLLNKGSKGYVDASARLPDLSDFSHSVAAGDIDGDGDIDVYVGNIYGEKQVDPYLLINNGKGRFTLDRTRLPESVAKAVSTFDGAKQSLAAKFVDLDGDRKLDLVLGAYDAPGISRVYLNDGKGRFTDGKVLNLPKNKAGGGAFTLVQDIQSADLDADGIADLVLISTTPEYRGWSVKILIGRGDGTFSDETKARIDMPHFSLSDPWTTFIELADANGDGTIDVIFRESGYLDDGPAFLFNDGTGRFAGMMRSALTPLHDWFFNGHRMPIRSPDGLTFVQLFDLDGDLWIHGVKETEPARLGITGTPGADRLKGTKKADILFGFGGNDVLDGAAGKDVLHGGAGNDTLIGGAGADVLFGGAGSDTASYATAAQGVTANLQNPAKNKGDAKGDLYVSIENLTGSRKKDNLTGDSGANVIDGGGGADVINGGGGNDTLHGGTGKDRLVGGKGHDKLFGDAGNDTLIGGKGNDRLEGGAGKDVLTGGPGADTFVFRSVKDSPAKSGWDVITDFSRKQGDKINLKAIDARAGTPKNDAFTFIGKDAFSGRKGELRFDGNENKTFVYGDVNGDGIADLRIELTGRIDLVKQDFVL